MLQLGPTESEEVWVRYVQREPGHRVTGGKYGFTRGKRVYSARQHNTTNLLAPKPDFFRANGHLNRDQGA